MEWYIPILTIFAGLLAGVINTLAGSGSIVTISLLGFLGLDPKSANATNRIGVLIQSLVGARTFVRSSDMLPKYTAWHIAPAVLGAVVGSILASEMDKEAMSVAIGILFSLLLVLILIKPSSWLRTVAEPRDNARSPLSLLMFFAIGIYGGFIQAGVGIFLLSAMVLYSGYTLNSSNAVKLISVAIFTIPALAIFMYKGLIVWLPGILIAIGQSIGAYLAARFAMDHPKANIYVRYLLIVVTIAGIVKYLGLYKLVTGN